MNEETVKNAIFGLKKKNGTVTCLSVFLSNRYIVAIFFQIMRQIRPKHVSVGDPKRLHEGFMYITIKV